MAEAAAAATADSLADEAAGEGRRTTCSLTAPSLWLTSAVEDGKKGLAGEGDERAGVRRDMRHLLALLSTSLRPRQLVALSVFFDMWFRKYA